MADTFKHIGAVAINADKPLPETFKHISAHMVHVLARLAAKRKVQEQLRAEGVRLTLVKPREVQERATEYLAQHPEVWTQALARAHLIDEEEGQRKERQRLRREELRQRRSVAPTDLANPGTDNAG